MNLKRHSFFCRYTDIEFVSLMIQCNLYFPISANSFLESSSVSPDSLSNNSSGMEYSIDTEMSCLSNSSSSNSKGDKVLSQPLKCEAEAVSGNASKTSNVLKRHLDGFPTNSTTTQENQPPLQQNQSLNQNSSRREPPSKKCKVCSFIYIFELSYHLGIIKHIFCIHF